MNNNNEKQTWNYNWKARLKRNVLIFDLKVLSSQLTGMEFHILGAACEKAMIKQTPIIYNMQVQQVTISCTPFIVEVMQRDSNMPYLLLIGNIFYNHVLVHRNVFTYNIMFCFLVSAN